MHQRDEERQHAEMAAVVEQRQEARGEPRQRADHQDDGQHHERAGAERLDAQADPGRLVGRRIAQRADRHERADEQRDAGEQDRVIDELAPVPLHRLEAGAHFAGSDLRAAARAAGACTSAMREAERDDDGEHRPEQAMDRAVPARHARPRLAASAVST